MYVSPWNQTTNCPSDQESALSLLPSQDRVTVEQLSAVMTEVEGKVEGKVVVDVRTPPESEMCRLAGSVNIPLADLQWEGRWDEVRARLASTAQAGAEIYVLCRRGNDSQLAVGLLRRIFPGCEVRDVIGGLHAWTKHIDHSFPVY